MNAKIEYLSIVFRGGPANRFYQYHTATFLAKLWGKHFVFNPTRRLLKGLQHDPDFIITDFFKCNIHEVQKYDLIIRQFDNKGDLNPYWKDELLRMDVPFGNVLLSDGWYQTFWPDHITVPKLPDTNAFFDTSKAVFIHVRRGDYVGIKLGLDLTEYYFNAYEQIQRLFSDSFFLICSDDIEWCKNNLDYMTNHYFLENTGYKETLSLMSKCKRGAILSNSTFGIWGAYLARINNQNDSIFRVFLPDTFTKSEQGRDYGTENYIYPSWSERIKI